MKVVSKQNKQFKNCWN